MSPLEFATSLMAYCFGMGASVTSWGRTELHNAAVGGVDYSYHQLFLAADVVYDTFRPLEERRRKAKQLGLELHAEGDHDHVEPLERE